MMTLRHVWQEVRHNPLFALIYIFGTALALGSTTVLVAITNSMVAPIYPEYQRARTAYVSRVYLAVHEGSSYQYRLSYDAVRDYLYPLRNAEKVSAYLQPWYQKLAQPDNGGLDVPVTVKGVDPAFFEVFSFRFLAGHPFSQADFDSGLPVAVVGDRTARALFGATKPEDIVGKDLSLGFRKYRVAGVVLEATETEQASYAGIYYPYTSQKDYDEKIEGTIPFIGSFQAVLLTDDIDAVRRELTDIEKRFNSSQDRYEVYLYHQPVDHISITFDPYFNEDSSKFKVMAAALGLMILGLLIVPGLNLSGLIAGRMETRVAEMGVRKSFGATRGTLLRQILWENLFLTSAGTIVGYLLAYALLEGGIGAVFNPSRTSELSHGMMSAPTVFVSCTVLCFVLNILSGIIPVRNSLKRPIVQSLKEK